MHSYASDSNDRKVAPWVIGGIAVIVAFLFTALVEWQKIKVPWWIETPTIMTTYGIVYWAYNRFGWKWQLRGFRFSEIPNFGGTWFGEINSNHGEGTKVGAMFHIHQTWTDLCVELETKTS